MSQRHQLTALGSFKLSIPCIPANGLKPASPCSSAWTRDTEESTDMLDVFDRIHGVTSDVQPSTHLGQSLSLSGRGSSGCSSLGGALDHVDRVAVLTVSFVGV